MKDQASDYLRDAIKKILESVFNLLEPSILQLSFESIVETFTKLLLKFYKGLVPPI